MSESSRPDSTNVVQLKKPERNAAPHVALARLPAAMHALRDKARQQLQVMLRELFDRADDALFELADKATNNQEQNLYFDSMREVRIRRRSMETVFFRNIDMSFAKLLDPSAYSETTQKEITVDELSLVKNDELEEQVATDSMINKANDQFAEAVQHLTLRIDHLVPVKIYQKNNPLGVDVICHAFVDATQLINIDMKAKLVLLKLFDNLVMAKLGGLFQSLNQLLIDSNIMPSLKPERARKSTSTPPSHSFAGDGAVPQGTSQGSDQTSSYGTPGQDTQTNEVLQTLRELLGSRNPSTSPSMSGEEIASQDLINILSQAQQRNMSFNSAATRGDGAVPNLRELLGNMLGSGKQKPQTINQVDDDVINLVSMMFDFILDDRNLAAPMKALLGRLQIPMVKVAIADKSFFSKGGHPARRLLNEMAMAALGWQESSEENQRKDSLFNKMEMMVQTILSEFEADISIFGQLLSDFRAYLDKEKRRAQILEQRTIDAEDGKAKSERARADVDAALASVINDQILPASATKLLREAWANVMFITCLKHGTTSDEWLSTVNTAQLLVWSLTVPMDKDNRQRLLKVVPELLQKLRGGFESISFNPFDATQLFKQLESLHLARLRGDGAVVDNKPEAASETTNQPVAEQPQIAAAKPAADVAQVEKTAVSSAVETALSSPQAAQQPAKSEEVDSDTAGEPSAASVGPSVAEEVNAAQPFVVMSPAAEDKETELADDDQHLSLVANITQGSWFEMVGDGGQKFRCRLAAIIRPTGKYIFVNRSGMKVAEETRRSLALAMKSGRLRVLDDGMLFDRALEAVIGNLREGRAASK